MLVEEIPQAPETQETAANPTLDILHRHEGETLTKHTIGKIMEEIWGSY